MSAHPTRRGHRHLPKRIRMDYTGARQPTRREVVEAIDQVERSGVVEVVGARLQRRRDAERRLSYLGYEVALTLHGDTKGHKMHLVEVVRLINALHPAALSTLGMPEWRYDGCYDRFQRLHAQVARALRDGWRHVDATTGEVTVINRRWYMRAVAQGAIDLNQIRGCALAVDATAMESWGRLYGDAALIEADGEPREPADGFDES